MAPDAGSVGPRNKARKLPLTLEIVECDGPGGPTLTGINTNLPNRLAVEAIEGGVIDGLPTDAPLTREVRYGAERSRIDILLETDPPIWVEVKNVHLLRRADGVAEFPDCVTARGLKHLRELSAQAENGDRAVLLFIIQRADAVGFRAAEDLDPAYAQGLTAAAASGVEIMAYKCTVTPEEIRVTTTVPVQL